MKIVKKVFSRIYELDRHKNRKNKCRSISETKIDYNINSTQIPHLCVNSTQIPHIPQNENTSINRSNTFCINCNKEFSRSDSLRRHQQFYCLSSYDSYIKIQ